MYKFLYSRLPRNYKSWLEDYISYCDLKTSPERLFSSFLTFGLIISLSISFILFFMDFLSFFYFILVFVLFFLILQVVFHMVLIFIADNRANYVEEILPDALQIISSNMRAGLTHDKAILTSARPEFGPLEKELKNAAKETLSGKPLEEALKNMTKRIKSKLLERTISLLLEGLEKGGSITALLDSIALDIRQVRILKREIKSYVMMYGIFIFFAACIGAPLLYSVSIFLVETMGKFGGGIEIEKMPEVGSKLPLGSIRISEIRPEFLSLYSYIAIGVTIFFGSLLIGLVQEGTEKAGLRFLPIFLPTGFAVFFISQIAIRAMFAGFV
ncbi:MAG: type II secretion system F family protein [Candidatus Aenigmatarchaeota archaeon]